MSLTSGAAQAKISAEARRAAPWLNILVRGGYVAKGLLFGFIGGLAGMAALKLGGKVANQRGAIDTMAQFPLGPALLYAMSISLAAYSTWRLLTALFNPESHKPLKRIGHALSSIGYFGFAFFAFEAARGASDNGSGLQKWFVLIQSPAGRVLAVVVGLVLAIIAAAEAVKALKKRFMADLMTGQMSDSERKFAEWCGVVGICARSVIFFVTGWLLAKAGFHGNRKEAGGMSKSMQAVSLAPEGRWLLLAVAVGLIAFGFYMLVEARYRRIQPVA